MKNTFFIHLFLYCLLIYCLFSKSFQLFERGRKERTTSSQHGAYTLGHTHPTMANNNGTQSGNAQQISINFASVQIGVCNPTP